MRYYYWKSHIFKKLLDKSSYSWALSILKECIILRIPVFLNEIDDKLLLVTGVVTRGYILLLETEVHSDAKKALKCLKTFGD